MNGRSLIGRWLIGRSLVGRSLAGRSLAGRSLAGRRAIAAGFALALVGCDDTPSSKPVPVPSASVSASAAPSASASATPSAARKKPTPYDGPIGTVKGTITMVGDPAPTTSFSYPEGCEAAAGTYGKLFRLGQDGGLADAMVSVTHYGKKWIPPEGDTVSITIKECQYSQRTIVLTDGQHLEVKNLDPLTSYLPWLDGARSPASIVAVPQGEPVTIHDRGQGRYWLRDKMKRNFMVAHVFHLPYATVDVTALDGEYTIDRVPVGDVQVNVLLPQTMQRTSEKATVKEGETTTVDFELTFDASVHTPADGHGGTKPSGPEAVPPAPSSSASAAPAPSGTSL